MTGSLHFEVVLIQNLGGANLKPRNLMMMPMHLSILGGVRLHHVQYQYLVLQYQILSYIIDFDWMTKITSRATYVHVVASICDLPYSLRCTTFPHAHHIS